MRFLFNYQEPLLKSDIIKKKSLEKIKDVLVEEKLIK